MSIRCPTLGAPTVRWHYRRSLASRVTLLTTMAVGLAVAIVALGAYVTVRMQLQSSLDDSLVDRAEAAAAQPVLDQITDELRRAAVHARRLRRADRVRRARRPVPLPRPGRRDPARRARVRGRRAATPSAACARSAPAAPTTGSSRCRPRPTASRWSSPSRWSRSSDLLTKLGLVTLLFGIAGDHHRRGRRLGGGPQRAAAGAPADRRRRGHRPHRAAWRRSRSRATTRSPGWRRRSTRCSPRSRPRGTGSAGWSPTPATSCGPR